MPNLNASKKDFRKTKKRTASNSAALHKLRTLMKKAKATKDSKDVIAAVSVIDKAAKKGIIKNANNAFIKCFLFISILFMTLYIYSLRYIRPSQQCHVSPGTDQPKCRLPNK